MLGNSVKQKFIQALEGELPGESAQLLMAPDIRSKIKTSILKQFAAVLILIYPFENKLYTVFIKRPEYEGVHGGQIAFPGGKLELHDPNLQHTAIRECREELGIVEEVEILGKLSPLDIPVSGFEVHPYIGYTSKKPIWHPDPAEVERVLEIPLEFLINEKNKISEIWNLHGYATRVPFYKIDESLKIWGATAMITSEFIEILKKRFYFFT